MRFWQQSLDVNIWAHLSREIISPSGFSKENKEIKLRSLTLKWDVSIQKTEISGLELVGNSRALKFCLHISAS